MALATYNCFQIPMDVAFQPPEFETALFNMINGMVDFCFFLDILVSFRTSYMDPDTGEENNNSKEMAS